MPNTKWAVKSPNYWDRLSRHTSSYHF